MAAPEAANNAGSQGTFIPLLTLGIPANVVRAMVLGALTIHGLKPGPLLISQNPELFWGVITSMYLGNIMLLLFNIPMIALWVRILKVPYYALYPLILLFCVVGVYSTDGNEVEISPAWLLRNRIQRMKFFGAAVVRLARRGLCAIGCPAFRIVIINFFCNVFQVLVGAIRNKSCLKKPNGGTRVRLPAPKEFSSWSCPIVLSNSLDKQSSS